MSGAIPPDAIVNGLEWLAIALSALFIVFLPLELYRRYKKAQLTRASTLEMLASVSPIIPTLLTATLVLLFISTLFAGAAALQPWQIPTTPWTALAAIILVDFLYYIDHYCGHRIRLYWAVSHSVHHSSSQYDQTTALRISFVDGFLSPWFYLPAILLGFDPLLVAACLGLILAYQQWIHTETIGQLPLLDPWLNTPSNHRVHHGSNAQYLDKNYGAIFMIWDQLFGTYQPEHERVVYGLTQTLTSKNPIKVHLHEAVLLWRELKQAPNWQHRCDLLLRPPGWSAQDSIREIR